jgi:hypothetical protein
VLKTKRDVREWAIALGLAVLPVAFPTAAHAQPVQVKASIAPATPAWDKGIRPISSESYYHAIECGKQPGNPACLFWDADLCKNPDFELAVNTGYKQVAYEVWYAVRQKKPAPQPNYQAAQQTPVTIGVTAVRGSKNTLSGFSLKRAGKVVAPIDGGVASSRFTYDVSALAPTAPITIDIAGKERTISCSIDTATLRRMR